MKEKEKKRQSEGCCCWEGRGGPGVTERGPETVPVWFPGQQLDSSGAALPPALAPSPTLARTLKLSLRRLRWVGAPTDTMAPSLSWERDVMNGKLASNGSFHENVEAL